MVAMMTACDPGDKVIVFSPFYENYAADAILSGAEPIYVALRPPDFAFDREELRRAFAQKPKALVLCNPSNPCGKVFTREELLFILELAREHDAFVITDEVYEHIVYAPHRHIPFATLPGAEERTHDLRLALEDLLDHRLAARLRRGLGGNHRRRRARCMTFSPSAPRRRCRKRPSPRWNFPTATTTTCSPSTPASAIYSSAISGRPASISPCRRAPITRWSTSRRSASPMTATRRRRSRKRVGVTGVPGSSFFREPVHRYIRFHFAKKDETLHRAGERLAAKLKP